jgi:hypothetical protein
LLLKEDNMNNLESMINTIVRVRPLPLMRDKNEHFKPFDVDWIIGCSRLQGSRGFWLQTVSLAQGIRLPLKDDQVVSYRREKSADLKSVSEGLLTLNCRWTIFPEGRPAESVPELATH